MFNSLIKNDVPGVYASAHAGHSSLKSKESYVAPESASTKAINQILARNLSGENSISFKDIHEKERQKMAEKVEELQTENKENEVPSVESSTTPPDGQKKRISTDNTNDSQVQHCSSDIPQVD